MMSTRAVDSTARGVGSTREPSARGRRWSPVACGAGLCAALLLLGGSAAAQIFSPGKLSAPHGFLDSDCIKCHGGNKGRVGKTECLACHKQLRQRIRAKRGFHGRSDTTQCAKCHREHRGRRQKLVVWDKGQSRFDHRRHTGHLLDGKHAKLDCRKCHQPKYQQNRTVVSWKKGRRQRTFLGLSTQCKTCHKDPHQGRAGTKCEVCHDTGAFKPVTQHRGHDKTRYRLRGKHKRVPCIKCHPPQADKQLLFREVAHASCADCHKTPHKRFMGHGPKQRKFRCESCHNEQDWKKIGFKRASHPSKIPLKGGHARVPCRRCHGAKAEVKPKGTQCINCHKDLHKNRFGSACFRCHGSNNWRVKVGRMPKGAMTRSQRDTAAIAGIPARKVKAVTFHNKTRFPLTGRHITVSCKKCHKRGRRRRQRHKIKFVGKFARCVDCHRDEHKGQFAKRISRTGRHGHRCESCHPLGGLFLTNFSVERHEKGRFPLKGAHRAVPCNKCHTKKRPKARRFTFAKRDCGVCHKDKHRGAYRLTAQSRLSMRCATCHTEESFKKIVFDHKKSKLRLEGRHAQIACASCHRPDKRGRTVFRGVDAACESCHADGHLGQFTVAGKTVPCRRCHTPGDFKIASFDHRKLSKFPLTGKHEGVKCAQCHHKAKLEGRKPITVYRLGRTDCAACHRSPHERWAQSSGHKTDDTGIGQANAVWPRPVDCQTCHETSSWRAFKWPKRFDHGKVGYSLAGRHQGVPCARCHQPDRATTRRCNSCHTDRHDGRLGTACAECHTPTTWQPSAVLARHRKTRLPLTGWHAIADCSSCHPRNRDAVFRSVPATCYNCHASAYHDANTHPNHEQSGFGHRCEQCHRPTGWRPAAFSRSSAALRVTHPFRLSGAHARQPCAACHQGTRPSRRCASCHGRDRHRARAPSHESAELSRNCDRCHGESSWQPARSTAHRSRFPLLGRHAGIACVECHEASSTFRHYTCVNCHRRAKMATRHTTTPGFAHASRACVRCHPTGRK